MRAVHYQDSAPASEPEDEWTPTYERINPNDPIIAAPRWRDALERIAWHDVSWKEAALIAREALNPAKERR